MYLPKNVTADLPGHQKMSQQTYQVTKKCHSRLTRSGEPSSGSPAASTSSSLRRLFLPVVGAEMELARLKKDGALEGFRTKGNSLLKKDGALEGFRTKGNSLLKKTVP